jgi:hypothetical protein
VLGVTIAHFAIPEQYAASVICEFDFFRSGRLIVEREMERACAIEFSHAFADKVLRAGVSRVFLTVLDWIGDSDFRWQ